MELTSAQMRAIELMIEQQERLTSLVMTSGFKTPMDVLVRKFFESDNRGAEFERMILSKITKLLVPNTTESLTYSVVI